jgi:hypothetical protein
MPPDHWKRDGALFSAFDGEWMIEYALAPENTKLVRMGETSDRAPEFPDKVAELRSLALDEIGRRGTDPQIMHWLHEKGAAPFPRAFVPHAWGSRPPGYEAYFQRMYWSA